MFWWSSAAVQFMGGVWPGRLAAGKIAKSANVKPADAAADKVLVWCITPLRVQDIRFWPFVPRGIIANVIRRLYVNNFRCLENFELKLAGQSSVLLIGKNGSGKMAVGWQGLSKLRGPIRQRLGKRESPLRICPMARSVS